MSVSLADNTLVAIQKLVRRLTNSPSQYHLSDNVLNTAINTFYNNDFPYAIKIDQMRDLYTIYTQPYIDRYPVDVNYIQGIRSPVYFDGIQGGFYKDRVQFYNLWPRIPTKFNPASGDGSTQSFTFTITAPFLRNEVTLGITDINGNPISIKDDGAGKLYSVVVNAQTSSPVITSTVPGMYNQNLGNPGQQVLTYVGSVNYVSGAISFDLSLSGQIPAAGEQWTAWVSQYQTGRPYNMLFWNNEITIRPVPKEIHKLEVEVYLTPVQFMALSDHPILNQWWQYVAYGTSAEIQRQRNDFESVQMLMEGMKRQEAMVLERQGVEEISIPNYTLFNSTTPNPYMNNYWGLGIM